MNSSISFTDPGAILGKTFLRIAQVILVILAVGAGYMAYLGSEGLFSDWNIEMDSDLVEFFPGVDPESWIIYLFLGLALKFLFWFGILAWLERKI
ncbi:hypothetical protein Aoki45_26790 [Algoriphagus sp. oki45]|uniref:hypothetical protein n=1 Tax=Algoriphagus sp. oki45 TaxID=3067294 RepID=UPI0027EC16F3|nr:hypothetical protein Aoki45_26790 [Algoriphagus sp. oki45]